MTKTRSQTGTIQIKRENEEYKDTQLLHSVNNTSRNSTKITKRKPSKRNGNSVPDQGNTVEKKKVSTGRLSTSPKLSTQDISQEQINQLIRYVVNDKISLYEASKKVKLGYTAASHYYNLYNNDPEKKIPLPLQMPTEDQNIYTQEQIACLIKSIVDDGMSVPAASDKVNMNYSTASFYYKKYLKDPNRNIPILVAHRCSHEQINKLIGYLVDDNMSITKASKKVNMSPATANKYYLKFLNDPNDDIPRILSQGGSPLLCTQDQINTLIRSLVVNKMTIAEASKKANMCRLTGSKYYREYLKDPGRRIPLSRVKSGINYRHNTCTQDQIKNLISYIVDDKMTIVDASKKAKMSYSSGSKFYHEYLNDPNNAIPTARRMYNTRAITQDKVNELIGYIVNDKMTIKAASKKVNINPGTGQRHYRNYVDNQKHVISTSSSPRQDIKKENMDPETDQQYPDDLKQGIPSHIGSYKRCTQEQINKLIGLIIDDKMNITAAARIANMSSSTGRKYYKEYLKDSKIRAATHLRSYPTYTQDKVTEVIDYIVKHKMCMAEAARAAKVCTTTVQKFYRQYLSDPNNPVPNHIIVTPPHPQEKIDNLVRYIVEDKMTVKAAAKKAKMCEATGRKFYNRLVRDRQSPSN